MTGPATSQPAQPGQAPTPAPATGIPSGTPGAAPIPGQPANQPAQPGQGPERPSQPPSQPVTPDDWDGESDELPAGNYTAEQVQAILKRRLARQGEAIRRKAREASEKAIRESTEKAETEALKSKGELEKVLARYEIRIGELEAERATYQAKDEKLARYEAAVKAQVDQFRAEIPEHLHSLLDKLDIADQLEYIVQNRERLVGETPGNGKPGGQIKPVPGSPTPDDGAERKMEIAEKKRNWRESTRRRLIK